MPVTIEAPDGYGSLALAFGAALDQASRGKGSERHAEKDEPFSSQLICDIPKRLGPGGECFCLGQAVKKIYESRRLPPERARAELLGAVNYLAAAWILLGGSADVVGPAPEKPVSAPEDIGGAPPRFAKGDFVRYLTPDRGWRCGDFVGEEGDCFVVHGTWGDVKVAKGLVEKAD